MYRIAEKVLEYAESKAKYVETELSHSRSLQFLSEKREIKSIQEDLKDKLSVRVTLKKTSGYAESTDLKNYKKTVDEAVKIAKTSNPDKGFKGIPGPQKLQKPKSIFDQRVKELTPQKGIGLLNDLVSASRIDRKINPITAVLSAAYAESYFINSNGVEVKERGTSIDGEIKVKIGQVSASEFNNSRLLDFSFPRIGQKAGKLALKSLNPSKVKPGKFPTMLDPRAASSLFEMLVFHLSADKVQRSMSNFQGLMNQKIGVKDLTLRDHGLLEKGLFTSKIDAEGYPRQETILIKEGILKGFLYDFYTASKEKRESTGNCNSLRSRPSVGASNLIVKPGKSNRDRLIKNLSKGVLVTDLSGAGYNVVSGDFSLEIENGFLIEEGELKPIKGAMVAGNIFSLIKNIEKVCDNPRQVGRVLVPTLLVKELQIV